MGIFSLLQGDGTAALIALLYRIPAVLIALTLHEMAHGYVALRCGDPTAQMMGRLSFNPLRHLDPIGTACMLLFGFGWARPVPVNPRNYRHFRRDDILVSIAGVVMNFCLFLLSTLLMVGITQWAFAPEMWSVGELTTVRDFLRFDGWNFYSLFTGMNELFVRSSPTGAYYMEGFLSYVRQPWLLYVMRFLMNFSMINLSLALFNLLPVPPLDGYHVVNDIFLRGRLHLSARVMRAMAVVLPLAIYVLNYRFNLLGQAVYFVQGGILDGILRLVGLG